MDSVASSNTKGSLPEKQPQFQIGKMVEVQGNPKYIGLVVGVAAVVDEFQQIGCPTIKTYEYSIQCSHCGQVETYKERWLRSLEDVRKARSERNTIDE